MRRNSLSSAGTATVREALDSFSEQSRWVRLFTGTITYSPQTLTTLPETTNQTKVRLAKQLQPIKTFSGGCLGSRNDEERSEMRYVVRIAEFSESSKL